ncbi:MAG: synthetase, partial [Acidobacteria bacterium]|nr:synthetase [Acidobacteriota bacterium]
MASADVLRLDCAAAAAAIEGKIREQVLGTLRRRGAVVGLSGGIDSSVVATLCARALGQGRVVGLLMPERDSSGDSLRLGRLVADHLGIDVVLEDIAPTLAAAGCYVRQDEAIRTVFPEYGDGYRCKITLPSILDGNRFNLS